MAAKKQKKNKKEVVCKGRAPKHLYGRSALSNGTRLHFTGIDGRSRESRRWRDVYADAMRRSAGASEQNCRSFASLVMQRERLDAQLAAGEAVDDWRLVRLTNAIARLEKRLGLGGDDPDAEQVRQKREDREALLR